jgi:acyl-CoA dehydrogenase
LDRLFDVKRKGMVLSEFNAIISECRRFARNQIRPGVLDADLGLDTDWVKKIWKKSMALDLPVLSVPEIYDGAGYPDLCCAFVLDVLASECPGLASVFAYHYDACLLGMKGEDKQKEILFKSLTNNGDSSPSVFSVIFPSEDDEKRQRIIEKNGELYLSGESDLTGNTLYAQKFCVFAQDGDTEEGITCVIIDRNDNGISFDENAAITGLKVNPFMPVCFDDVKLNVDNVIGTRGKCSNVLEETRGTFFSFISAMAMGAVRSSWRKAFEYAEERYQFGKVIIHHQEIQRMLGNMMMKLKIGTSAYIQVFEDENPEIRYSQPEPSLTKAFCTDAALEIILDAIQIHGGYGYMHEYGLEKIMRDVKVLQVLGGKNPCHHIDAVRKEVR